MPLIKYLEEEGILDIFLKECRKSSKLLRKVGEKYHTFITLDDITWDTTENGWTFWHDHYIRGNHKTSSANIKALLYNYKKPSIFKRVINEFT